MGPGGVRLITARLGRSSKPPRPASSRRSREGLRTVKRARPQVTVAAGEAGAGEGPASGANAESACEDARKRRRRSIWREEELRRQMFGHGHVATVPVARSDSSKFKSLVVTPAARLTTHGSVSLRTSQPPQRPLPVFDTTAPSLSVLTLLRQSACKAAHASASEILGEPPRSEILARY